MTPFEAKLAGAGFASLVAEGVTTLQVNVGKVCNQVCKHCHVDAGPHRTESMSAETVALVLDTLRRHPEIGTLDITGGAPELNPSFRTLVQGARALGRRVIDRCNLTILLERGHEDLAAFLAEHRVEVTASLPYFLQDSVDRQRGKGVYDKSIEALRRLDALGYGKAGTGLILNLVYNPIGAYLPPAQGAIEAEFKRELAGRFSIEFNNLFTITNMPISRFKKWLEVSANYAPYMAKLESSFNPMAVSGVMCRTLISVGWDGRLYDCDFNQMLDLPITDAARPHLRDFDATLATRTIATGDHCYGCTAGAGSSCGGALA